MEFLTYEDKKYLLQWTDPRHPPSEQVFSNWIKAISEGAKGLDMEERVSLADFGPPNRCFRSRSKRQRTF